MEKFFQRSLPKTIDSGSVYEEKPTEATNCDILGVI